MTEETCDAETGDGGTCQNPAGENGRCWIPSHNPDSDEENPQGRPSKFNDERARSALHAARQAKSEAGCARAAGVGKATLARWKEENPTFIDENGQKSDFRNAFRRARADGETILIQGGLRDDNVDPSMAKFLLSTSFEYVKTERHEVEGEHAHQHDVTEQYAELVGAATTESTNE